MTDCSSFDSLKDIVEKHEKGIGAKDIHSLSQFTTRLSEWYFNDKDKIEKCASSLPFPTKEDATGYARNIMSDTGAHIIFTHRIKPDGSTPLHSHSTGNDGDIIILPVTGGLKEQSFVHNISDFSLNSRVNLYPIGEHKVNIGEVYTAKNDTIHKVINPSKEIQSFVEIYVPHPDSLFIYIPYYKQENDYIQLKPIQTNLPYYKSLSKGDSAEKIKCESLNSDTTNKFLAFTSTEHAIEDVDTLQSYISDIGCSYIEKVSDDTYIVFSETYHDEL